MLKIGELAKKTGVSVRSLRHYDALGLLKPSSRSVADYRLYTKNDILRLQQIVSLKQIGFSLVQIQEMLKESDSLSLQATLKMHQQFLREQLQQQHRLNDMLQNIIDTVKKHDEISVEKICQTMENIKMLEKYYTQEQLAGLKQRFSHFSEEEGETYHNEWVKIFTELEKLRQAGILASDKRTQSFAVKSRELLAIFTAGNKGIEKSLDKMYQQEGGAKMLRSHGFEISEETYAYYEAAVRAHTKSCD